MGADIFSFGSQFAIQQETIKDMMEIIVHLLEILYFDLSVVHSTYSKKRTQEYLLARRENGGRNGKVVIKNASAYPGWCGSMGWSHTSHFLIYPKVVGSITGQGTKEINKNMHALISMVWCCHAQATS